MPAEEYWNSFFNARCILNALKCQGAGDVVEFGCGYGLFTLAAAQAVSGTVYALDVDPAMIAVTRAKAIAAGLDNVHVEQRDFVADGSGRADESIGYVMLFNILHIENPLSLLREAYRILEPGGKLGIIHWNYDPKTPRGPSMDIRPRPNQCRAWAEAAGFEFLKSDSLPCCPHHYGLLLRRPPI